MFIIYFIVRSSISHNLDLNASVGLPSLNLHATNDSPQKLQYSNKESQMTSPLKSRFLAKRWSADTYRVDANNEKSKLNLKMERGFGPARIKVRMIAYCYFDMNLYDFMTISNMLYLVWQLKKIRILKKSPNYCSKSKAYKCFIVHFLRLFSFLDLKIKKFNHF